MSAVTTLIWDRRYQNTTTKRIKDAAIVKRQRTRQQNIAGNEDILMREEEAWRRIQDQDVENEEEEDGETVPTFSRELSRRRPQESTDEQKENKDDQPRPIRTRRLKKGPSELTESQPRARHDETPEEPEVQAHQESAGNNEGSRKRPQVDTSGKDTYNKNHHDEGNPPPTRLKRSVEITVDAVADESQVPDRQIDALDLWYEDAMEMPETPESSWAKRRSKEQKNESRSEGTSTQDTSSRKMKRRRTGVG